MRRVTLKLPNDTELLLEAPPHLYIPRVLERDGLARYETDTLAAVLSVVSLNEGPFIDVGANVGVFTLLVSAVLGRPAFAFEPLPDAAEVLEKTAQRYQLPVAVSRVALSDRGGTAEFYVSAQTDSSSGLNKRFRPVKDAFEVSLSRFDDVLPSQPPALVKIDTETTEPAVLAGAAGTIDRHRPYLIIEVLKNRTETQIESFFAGRGYTWYHIVADERWAPSSRVEGDPTYAHNNGLFAPAPLPDAFWDTLAHWRERLSSAF